MRRRAEGRGAPPAALVAALALLALGAAAPTRAAETADPRFPAHFEYLYVEANEGGSAGGHVALQIGPRTYHLLFAESGLLEMQRDASDAFRRGYRLLENRTIHRSRVAVEEPTLQALRAAFDRRYLTQRAQIAHGDALDAEAALLEALQRRARGEATGPLLRVEAAGYFGSGASGSPALARLREAIRDAHGADALSRRRARTLASLAALGAGAPPNRALADPAIDRLPTGSPLFVSRLRDLGGALAVLSVLERAPALRPGTFHAAGEAGALTAVEGARLRELAARLETRLLALFVSRRPDWAGAFLVEAARLAAVEASLAAGRWVVLDTWREDARLASDDPPLEGRFLARLEARRADRLAAARREFAAGGGRPVRDYARVEAAWNGAVEVAAAVREGRPLRLRRETPVPALAAPLPPLALEALPVPGAAGLEAAARRARIRARTWRRGLARLYGYDVVTRNCVTELFDVVEAALARLDHPDGEPTRDRIRRSSEVRLGGFVEPHRSLAFVPFISSDRVRARYRVVETAELPSWRRAQLAALYADEPDLRVYLREANTLTSTLYRPHDRDSFFLLFTDDVVWLRPVYGVVNLLAATGQTVAGLGALPFDGGGALLRGLSGALVSLPELFFWNIRKGSNPTAPDSGEVARP